MKAGTIAEAAFVGRKRFSTGAGGGGGSICRGEAAVSTTRLVSHNEPPFVYTFTLSVSQSFILSLIKLDR